MYTWAGSVSKAPFSTIHIFPIQFLNPVLLPVLTPCLPQVRWHSLPATSPLLALRKANCFFLRRPQEGRARERTQSEESWVWAGRIHMFCRSRSRSRTSGRGYFTLLQVFAFFLLLSLLQFVVIPSILYIIYEIVLHPYICLFCFNNQTTHPLDSETCEMMICFQN